MQVVSSTPTTATIREHTSVPLTYRCPLCKSPKEKTVRPVNRQFPPGLIKSKRHAKALRRFAAAAIRLARRKAKQ